MAKEDQKTTEAEAEGADESSAKEIIYERVRDLVKERTGKNIGKSGGRDIFDTVVNEIFAAATREGTLRFNGGFGSLHVRQYQAGERQLPSGQKTVFGEREKLRYEEGVVVKALVANKGDLEEALKARGTRAPKEGAEKPAKEKAVKEKPAKATPPPAPTEDGDLNLD